MSENQLAPPQESAVAKVERLKLQIAQKLKERAAAQGGVSESVAKAEMMVAQVRARLMGGQAAIAGRSAVQHWMEADGQKNR